MTSISSVALAGLNAATARASAATQNIVNETSTPAGLAGGIVQLQTAKTQVDIGVQLLKTDNKLEQSLINILT